MNKSPEQLKGAIRNIAKDKNLRAQEVLQMFFFERIIERLAESKYSSNFILKGGLLISSMIGIAERTTMDMDTTVQGIDMNEEEIKQVIKDIIAIDVDDGVSFVFQRIEPIREEDEYNNFRVYLKAVYGKIDNPMKIDITTGDAITPRAINYKFSFIFEDRSVTVMAYSLETIIAEKYETIIRRNIGNTRARDFYDIYTLYRWHREDINAGVLREAVYKTAEKRDSISEIEEWEEILFDIQQEPEIYHLWENYVKDNAYIGSLSFDEVLGAVKEIGELIVI